MSDLGLVRNSGILRPEHIDRIKDAYRLYRGRADRTRPNEIEARILRRMYSHEETDIHCVGVWDTVGALGIPIDGVRLPFAQKLWGFHDTALSSRVRFAYQGACHRRATRALSPHAVDQQPDATGQTLEQVWFAGVHFDVGGGYPEPELAEIALLWLVNRARACGLAFKPEHFLTVNQRIDEERRRVGATPRPNALGKMHESRTGFYLLLPRHQRSLTDPDGTGMSLASKR